MVASLCSVSEICLNLLYLIKIFFQHMLALGNGFVIVNNRER